MKYAPIVLIVYNRPKHLLKTLKSLKKNSESKYSEIFIFSDGYKADNLYDRQKVFEVRKLIKKIGYFKKKHIFENKKNLGLKKNIINAINYVLNKYSKVIVLEDDIIVSKYFLHFMNNSLIKYQSKKKVWHISGWNYAISNKNKINNIETFFIRNMNCWGWGTWRDRWKKLNLNPVFFKKKFNKRDKYLFNLNNSFENFSQILRNDNKKISTWAIFWSATIFYHKGLCLNPLKSLTRNIGQDKSGTNSVNDYLFTKSLNNSKVSIFPKQYIENHSIRNKIILFLNKNKNKSKIINLFLDMYNRLFY